LLFIMVELSLKMANFKNIKLLLKLSLSEENVIKNDKNPNDFLKICIFELKCFTLSLETLLRTAPRKNYETGRRFYYRDGLFI